MAEKKYMSSDLQTLVNIRSSIQTTSSIYGRKVGTYPLLLRQTCLMHLPCRSGSVPPWPSLAELTPLWPVSFLGWPQYPFGIPWILRTFLPSPRAHTCLDSVSCCTTKGYRMSLRGRSSGCPPICFLPVCLPHKLAYSFQSDAQTFCSSAFGTWRLRSWARMVITL